mmetsp:Transcript_9550/g.58179  ORF Transcript_9550/g.58179 Transcript_9550/m.58179 type:complete len:167 (-) Transcript_9550:828-1328(-)
MNAAYGRRGMSKTQRDVDEGKRATKGKGGDGWAEKLKAPGTESRVKTRCKQAPNMKKMVDEFLRKTKKMKKLSRRWYKDLNKELQFQLGGMERTRNNLVRDSEEFLQEMNDVEQVFRQEHEADLLRLEKTKSHSQREPKYHKMCRRISEKLRSAKKKLQCELKRFQ